MRLGYFANGPLFLDEKRELYTITYKDEWLARYLRYCDSMVLCMRIRNCDSTDKLSKITLREVSYVECPDLERISNINKICKAKNTIKRVLQECDLVVVRLPSTIGTLAVDGCKALGKPYLVEAVGCPWDSLWNHSLRGKLVALPRMMENKRIIKHAPAVLYVTNSFLQRRYPTDGRQIGCSDVEIGEPEQEVLEKRLKKIGNLNKNKIIIGTTAAVDIKYKGQQYVIRALGELKKNGINKFEYQLVGMGDQSYLKSVAVSNNLEKEVVFKGAIPHDEVFNWLDSIDIYVQPSMQEGLPRALVEAMSRGLPAIGANTGGIPELLNESCIFKTGLRSNRQIISILASFNARYMTVQAKRNFEVASHYNKADLDTRRDAFYRKEFDLMLHNQV